MVLRVLCQIVGQPNRPSAAVPPCKLAEQILGGTGRNRMTMIARCMIFNDSSFSLANLSALILDLLSHLFLRSWNPAPGAKHDLALAQNFVIISCL
jgi:hypothetical protein